MGTQYTQRITLDLDGRAEYRYLSAKKGDSESRFLHISLTANGEPVSAAGVKVLLRCAKPDGNYVCNPATVHEDGTVTVELTQQILAAEGLVIADLCLCGDEGEILSTASFAIQVEQVPYGKEVNSTNEFLELLRMVEKGNAVIGDYESALDQLDAVWENLRQFPPTVTVIEEEAGHWMVVTDKNGEQRFWVADGEQGPRGPAGENGTATDEQVAAWLQAHPEVTTSLQKGEVTPQKTSFIDCFYEEESVLVPDFTNQLPISLGTDGEVYNATGWKANTRINSSGEETAIEGFHVTGYIPCGPGDVVRTGSGVIVGENDNQSLCRFDTNMTYLGRISYNAFEINGFTVSEDGALYAKQSTSVTNLGYIRIVGAGIGDDAIVTVNEEITYTLEDSHAEPTDFCLQERIRVPLAQENESRIDTMEAMVSALNEELPPAYVLAEADRVADLVAEVQGGNTFSFAALSDLHYIPSDVNTPAISHAAHAVKRIGESVKLDAVAVLGDVISGASGDSLETCKACYAAVNKKLAEGLQGITNVRLNGNHDCQPYCYDGFFTQDQIFARIGAWNAGAEVLPEDQAANYGYLDFPERKLRLIYLNTCDIAGIKIKAKAYDFTGNRIGHAQLKWLIETLKATAAGWNVIVMGHHPLDWASNYYTDANGVRWEQNTINGAKILSDYVMQAAGNIWLEGEKISYDFTTGQKATVVGYIHGHTHNFVTGTMGDADILRIAVPNALPGRENGYTTVDGMYEETSYPKTAGTAKDTAFCVITVDLENRTIHAHHYGAGYDREISY